MKVKKSVKVKKKCFTYYPLFLMVIPDKKLDLLPGAFNEELPGVAVMERFPFYLG